MRAASTRRGRGGRGLAVAARASAASKLAEAAAAVATPLPAIRHVRTSPRLQPSASSLLAASDSVNASISSATSENQAARTSTSTAVNQMGVGASSVTTPNQVLMKRFDSPCGTKSDDGSISRKKGGNYDDDDDDSDEKEGENGEEGENGNDGDINGGVNDNLQFNETEIEEAANFFGGNDEDSESRRRWQ